MSVFLSVGPALKKICCLEVSCAVGGRFTEFYFTALAGHVFMKAHVYQELTLKNSFTWLWPRITSYVGIVVGWGQL